MNFWEKIVHFRKKVFFHQIWGVQRGVKRVFYIRWHAAFTKFKLPTWGGSYWPSSRLNRPRRGTAVLISDALRTGRLKWFGGRPYPVSEPQKKSELAPRTRPQGQGARLDALGGWPVSDMSAWASKPFLRGKMLFSVHRTPLQCRVDFRRSPPSCACTD